MERFCSIKLKIYLFCKNIDLPMTDFRDIIAGEVGGEPEEVSKFSEGLQHETFRVEYDGEEAVFQFAVSRGRKRRLLYKNAFWYEMLDGLGLPVPSVLSDGVRRSGDVWYFVTDFLDGENAERDVTEGRVRNAGRNLAMLHESCEVEGVKFCEVDGSEVSLVDVDYGDWLREMFRESIERFRDDGMNDLADDLEAVEGTFDRSVPTDFESVVCHNDYSPDNVLFRGDEDTWDCVEEHGDCVEICIDFGSDSVPIYPPSPNQLAEMLYTSSYRSTDFLEENDKLFTRDVSEEDSSKELEEDKSSIGMGSNIKE